MNKNVKINIGDLVIPQDCPILASKVEKIELFAGELTYVLENRTRYTKNELVDIEK